MKYYYYVNIIICFVILSFYIAIMLTLAINPLEDVLTFHTIGKKNLYMVYQPLKTSFQAIVSKLLNDINYKCNKVTEFEFVVVDKNDVVLENINSLSSSLDSSSSSSNPLKIQKEDWSKSMADLKLISRPHINIVPLFGQSVLPTNLPTNNYDISADSINNNIEKSQHQLQIFVKTMGNNNFTFFVLPTTYVYELKILIADKMGILNIVNMQRLINNSKQLLDEHTMAESNITNESTIHFLLRLCGGMYHETSGKDGAYCALENNLMFYVEQDIKN